MDIHRCRFVPYPSSAINALAFSHADAPLAKKVTSPNTPLVRLAVGRANGDIEIWNPARGAWHHETTIFGGKDRSVDGLVWVTGPTETLESGKQVPGRARLFSIGYTPTVTEWDLERARPRRHASGQHGAIWCLAAQPAPKAASGKPMNGTAENGSQLATHVRKLVGGTADGELVLYSVDNDELEFEKVIVRSTKKRAQMVCLAFQSHDTGVAGCTDSTIRVFSVRRAAVIRVLSIGREATKGQGHTSGGISGGSGSRDVIVWSVRVLDNGDIASADSTGEVKIWDAKTFSLAQRVAGAHDLDVLSLAVSRDGTHLVSGGMDRRIAMYRKEAVTGRWAKVFSRRYHHHDVKALAEFEQGQISVIVSGGPDGTPVVTPLRELGRENHRTLPNLPQCPPLASAWAARLVVSWWERTVHIWRIVSGFNDLFSEDNDRDWDKNHKLLKTIVIKGEASITSATIDPTGRILVVSTANEIKAFYLDHDQPIQPSDVSITQINLPRSLAKGGASKVQLSPDSQWLCVVRHGLKILISKITCGEDGHQTSIEPQRTLRRLHRRVPRAQLLGGLGRYDRSITQVAFSNDSRVLAIADLAGYIDTWVINDATSPRTGGVDDADDDDASALSSDSSSEEESASQDSESSWIRNPKATLIHKFQSSPVVLSFGPADMPPQAQITDGVATRTENADYPLLVVTKTWDVEIINVLGGSLSDWTKRNAARIPDELVSMKDLAMGAMWQGRRVWIYGTSFLSMLDTEQDLDPSTTQDSVSATETGTMISRKRKRHGVDSGAGSKMKMGNLAPKTIMEFDPETEGPGRKLNQNYKPDKDELGSDEDEDIDMEDAPVDDERVDLEKSMARRAEGLRKRPTWWLTYKYRPLLGIVALSSPDAAQVEVALVERPLWDVDLPERFMEENNGRGTGLASGA